MKAPLYPNMPTVPREACASYREWTEHLSGSCTVQRWFQEAGVPTDVTKDQIACLLQLLGTIELQLVDGGTKPTELVGQIVNVLKGTFHHVLYLHAKESGERVDH